MFPKMIGQNWMDAMLHWMEVESNAKKDDALTLRMDEFVSKDAAKKEDVPEAKSKAKSNVKKKGSSGMTRARILG